MIGFQGFSDRRNEDCRRHYRIMRRELRMPEGTLFLVVDALDSWGDGGEHLVGDSVGGFAHLIEKSSIAEDNHIVALLTGDTRDVNKTHIHTDASDDGSFPTSYGHLAALVAQTTTQSIGIAYGDDCDAGVTLGNPTTVVSDRIATRDILELGDARL